MYRRSRGITAAFTMAVLAVAAPGVSAQAAAPLEVVFHAGIFECSEGTAIRGEAEPHELTVELRSSDGAVLDSQTTTTDAAGRFEVCFATRLKSGRKLRAFDGGPGNPITFTIPTLSVSANRITDVVKGTGPKDKEVRVRLYDCSRLTNECILKASRFLDVSSTGNYQKDFSSSYDARGYDLARVRYTSSAGHTLEIERTFSWMAAVINESMVFGEVQPNQQVTLRLRDSDGDVLSTKTRTGSLSGDYVAEFGNPIRANREVRGDFASDARLIIPPTSLTLGESNGDQLMTARCLPNRKMEIDINGIGDVIRTANAQGNATINMSNEFGDGVVRTDERVRVTCQAPSGDILIRSYED